MLSSAIYADGFIGHEAVIRRLERLLKGRMPHALLFTGPAGVGKFLAARWTAAAFLCPEGGCGTCTTCRRVRAEIHPDLYVVRTDEDRRDILIQQVRNLTAAVGTKPFEGRGRAAIIDEAERMNEEAQNAFLKTLEEPPPNTLIVLVSSGEARLLPTIRSRCPRVPFHRLSDEEMARYIAEHLGSPPPFTERIAQGSPGRLAQLSAMDAGAARRILVEFTARGHRLSPARFTSDLLAWAAGEGLLKQAVRERLRTVLWLWAGLLRDLVVLACGGTGEHLVNIDLEVDLREAVERYPLERLFHLLAEIQEAGEDIAGYVDPGLVMENLFRAVRDAGKRG